MSLVSKPSGRELPDDAAPSPLATGIPAAATGAVGASFDAPAAATASGPPRMFNGHPKASPPPPALPPDPFGNEGAGEGEGGGPPKPLPPPKKPPKPKGLAL